MHARREATAWSMTRSTISGVVEKKGSLLLPMRVSRCRLRSGLWAKLMVQIDVGVRVLRYSIASGDKSSLPAACAARATDMGEWTEAGENEKINTREEGIVSMVVSWGCTVGCPRHQEGR